MWRNHFAKRTRTESLEVISRSTYHLIMTFSCQFWPVGKVDRCFDENHVRSDEDRVAANGTNRAEVALTLARVLGRKLISIYA